jgi:hypothetical protein
MTGGRIAPSALSGTYPGHNYAVCAIVAVNTAVTVPGVSVTVKGGVTTVVPSGAMADAAAWNDVPVSFEGTL